MAENGDLIKSLLTRIESPSTTPGEAQKLAKKIRRLRSNDRHKSKPAPRSITGRADIEYYKAHQGEWEFLVAGRAPDWRLDGISLLDKFERGWAASERISVPELRERLQKESLPPQTFNEPI